MILKKKTVYNNFEKLRTKGIIFRKIGSGRKSRLTNDLEIKISQTISDDSDLDVSEIKDELCEQGIEVNQRTRTRYLREKNELWAQTPNKRYDEPYGWPYGCQIEMVSIL